MPLAEESPPEEAAEEVGVEEEVPLLEELLEELPPPLFQLASAEAVREAARINVRILDFFIMTSKKQSVFKFYRTRRSRMPRRRPTEKDYPLTAPIMTPFKKYLRTKG